MIIKNAKVFTKDYTFKEKDIFIQDGFFSESAEDEECIDGSGLYAIPGLTDIHFHGCTGYDFCDGTKEAVSAIADYQLKNGITTIAPATMTFEEDRLEKIMKNAAAYQSTHGASLVGINMEGPFISTDKKGAQNPRFIHHPDLGMYQRLQKASGGLIKLVDIAPEEEGSMAFIKAVKDEVAISIAHTTADYDTADEAFTKGASQVTHLYNAMPPFLHRAPGVIGAAFDHKNVKIELICDGVHIHPSVVRATFKLFDDDRIILISDSMMAAGLKDGEYSLGGQAVKVMGPRATLKDGTIAGSVTNLMDCMRTAVLKMKVPLESAVKAATVNPAKSIGIFDLYGSIETGKVGNVVLLDQKLNLVDVIQKGQTIR